MDLKRKLKRDFQLMYETSAVQQNSSKDVSRVPTATLKLLNFSLLQSHILGSCWAFKLHSMKGSQENAIQ
jgi:hypothetical protein